MMIPILVILLCCCCSSSAVGGYFMFFGGEKYRKEEGIDYPGGDIFDMTGQGEDACFRECDNQDRCVGVVFTGDKRTCWGKQALPNRTPNSDRITYIKK